MHNISSREKLTYTGSLLGQNMIYSFVTMISCFSSPICCASRRKA